LDAPLHKVAGGAPLDSFPLSSFAAVPAYIADLRADVAAGTAIGAELLAARLPDARLDGAAVLLATGWGDRRAKTDEWLRRSPFVSPEGAAYLVGRGIAGVGIDHYSVGGGGKSNEETHQVLLGAGVWILEELRFPAEAFALPQPASLWAVPVNLGPGISGSFCRPVLAVGD
jgi:kynurenine formamidase